MKEYSRNRLNTDIMGIIDDLLSNNPTRIANVINELKGLRYSMPEPIFQKSIQMIDVGCRQGGSSNPGVNIFKERFQDILSSGEKTDVKKSEPASDKGPSIPGPAMLSFSKSGFGIFKVADMTDGPEERTLALPSLELPSSSAGLDESLLAVPPLGPNPFGSSST